MPEHPRIEELRRRVLKDPASIAFAQLAEEYRRSGNYDDAIGVCRAGLAMHPGYLSARVTLGRALLELNDLDAAEVELSQVLRSAPENLAAIRGVAEVHHRRGNLSEALQYYQTALGMARHDPDLEQTVDEISRALAPAREPIADELSFDDARAEFLAALEQFEALGAADAPAAEPFAAAAEAFAPAGEVFAPAAEAFAPAAEAFAPPAEAFAPAFEPHAPAIETFAAASQPADLLHTPEPPPAAPVPYLHELERFLDAIQAYRQRQTV